MNRVVMSVLIGAGLSLVAGCGEGDAPATGGDAAVTPEVESKWLLTSEPADAMSVTEAKASVQEGDEVVVRARIGGRMEPISSESPVFTVMDLSLPHCGQLHGDRCPTPWDYCCASPESITANAATVQLVDAEGKALAIDPTAAGLQELDELVLVGKVGPRPSAEVLTIKASGVYRVVEEDQAGG